MVLDAMSPNAVDAILMNGNMQPDLDSQTLNPTVVNERVKKANVFNKGIKYSIIKQDANEVFSPTGLYLPGIYNK